MKETKADRIVLFDVIGADGTKIHVPVPPTVFALLRTMGAGLVLDLILENKVNAIIPVCTQRQNPDLHLVARAEEQAIFRLGQMDMQASVCDMLRAMANGAAEGIRPGLTLAADLVESMEVGHADS